MLVAAARSGDDQAFEQLYLRYRGRIRSYVFGMVGDHGRAEDIAQEVFISALGRLRHTERPIAFKPWIYEIAKNACIDEYRRMQRLQEVSLDLEGEPGVATRLQSTAPAPEAAVESKQRLADLCGAFGGLSESHHKIIVLRELEGLSYSQIGERMGMSRPVVESTLFRARRRLGEEYEELASGRRCEQVRAVADATQTESATSLGIRQRRLLARHLAHCQPCRRHARMTGFDESLLKRPSLAGKLAALLPFGWLPWRRARGKDNVLSASASHSGASWRALQTAATFADPGAPTAGFGRAAAAAAALVIAGAGGGFATGLVGHGGHSGHAGRPPSTPQRSSQSTRPGAAAPVRKARVTVIGPPAVSAGHQSSSGLASGGSTPGASKTPAPRATNSSQTGGAGGAAGSTTSTSASAAASSAAPHSGGSQTGSAQVGGSQAGGSQAGGAVAGGVATLAGGVKSALGALSGSSGASSGTSGVGSGANISLPSVSAVAKQLGLPPVVPNVSPPPAGQAPPVVTPPVTVGSVTVPSVTVPNPVNLLSPPGH